MISKRNLIRSAAIILGSFLFGFLAMWWLRYDIEVQSNNAERIKTRIDRDINLVANLARLKSDAQKASAYEKRLSSLLPQKDRLIDFRNFLEALASQRKVTTSFSFEGLGGPSNEGGISSIGFSLEMTGALSSIEGLIQDLEEKPRSYLLAFDSFDLSESSGSYRVLFRGKLFYKETDN
jgi:Tfp pilus assembly protein PilO